MGTLGRWDSKSGEGKERWSCSNLIGHVGLARQHSRAQIYRKADQIYRINVRLRRVGNTASSLSPVHNPHFVLRFIQPASIQIAWGRAPTLDSRRPTSSLSNQTIKGLELHPLTLHFCFYLILFLSPVVFISFCFYLILFPCPLAYISCYFYLLLFLSLLSSIFLTVSTKIFLCLSRSIHLHSSDYLLPA